MKFKDHLDGNVAVFELSGRMMGGPEATLFHGRLHEYVTLNKRHILLDLAGVNWTNSQGLGMLINALKTVNGAGGRLALANIDGVESLLAISRLASFFEHYDSAEDAMRSLAD